jgi:hypothetical protein
MNHPNQIWFEEFLKVDVEMIEMKKSEFFFGLDSFVGVEGLLRYPSHYSV